MPGLSCITTCSAHGTSFIDVHKAQLARSVWMKRDIHAVALCSHYVAICCQD